MRVPEPDGRRYADRPAQGAVAAGADHAVKVARTAVGARSLNFIRNSAAFHTGADSREIVFVHFPFIVNAHKIVKSALPCANKYVAAEMRYNVRPREMPHKSRNKQHAASLEPHARAGSRPPPASKLPKSDCRKN